MTNTIDRKEDARESAEGQLGWFNQLLQRLPTIKLTAAQTGNLVGDGLGIVALVFYFVLNKPPPEYALIVVLVVIFLIAWCHWVSKPRRR